MKKAVYFPLIFFFAFTLFFFKPFFVNNLLPVPADLIVGLYHPFRDLYAPEYPRGIPFKNPLISDPVTQQIVWRKLSLSQISQGQLPLWNPYQMAGYPLLGNIQSAPFYPLNILFLFLPFIYGWSLLIISQIILALFFMYIYLRSIKRSYEAAVLGATAFAFSGFMISWLEWGTIGSTALWFPLILYGIEKAKEKKSGFISGALITSGILCSFLAGHTQTFFYGMLLVTSYGAATIYQARYRKQISMPLIASLVVSIVLLLPVLFPQIRFILLSARSIDLDWHADGWFIPFQHLIQFVAPNFFGNPATGNYFGVWNYGEFIGYVGMVPILFAIVALLVRREKRIWFFSAVVLLSLLLSLPTPLAKLVYKFDLPFFSTTQPTRLLFLADISLAVLAAFGLDYLKNKRKTVFISLSVLLLFLLVSVGFGFLQFNQKAITNADWNVTQRNLILPFVLLFSTLAACLLYYFGSGFIKKLIVPFLLLLTFFDLFTVANKYNSFSPAEYFFPQTKIISFLQNRVGNNRIMITDRRILHPNMSTYYQLQSIDGYDPLYLYRYGELFAALGRMKPDITAPFGYYRILTTEHFHNPVTHLLGVKYILSLKDLDYLYLKKVFQEGETRVYENSNTLERSFFVESVTSVANKQEAITFLFEKNLAETAVVENQKNIEGTYVVGKATITSYTPEKITIDTQNEGRGFLLLSDTYYPTWHAFVDGVETPIYQADFALRGIVVPKGKHVIEFSNTLF